MKKELNAIIVWLVLLSGCLLVGAEDVERKLTTAYDIDGRPFNQSQKNPGLHTIFGTAKLSSGVDTVTLNTSVSEGRQNISFLGDSTYSGTVLPVTSADTDRYWIVPLSGNQFIIKSSDAADTSTVRFKVEGQ